MLNYLCTGMGLNRNMDRGNPRGIRNRGRQYTWRPIRRAVAYTPGRHPVVVYRPNSDPADHEIQLPAHTSRISETLHVQTQTRKFRLRLLRPTSSWHLTYNLILLLAVLAVPISMVVTNRERAARYNLSPAARQLVHPAAVSLDTQLVFNAKTKTYAFNPGASTGVKPLSNGEDAGKQVGGTPTYGVSLASYAQNGMSYTDAVTKTSFSLTPQFDSLPGKHLNGSVVYPITGSSAQMVYTLKDDGLKEDLVLNQAPKTKDGSISFSYSLTLPSGLEARQQADGSIGVYSADPSLYGNISYGSDSDKTAVDKARTNAQKTNLVFSIPAPSITESLVSTTSNPSSTQRDNRQVSASSTPTSQPKASFSLKGNTLTVTATNLTNLRYPISIDPSVVVQSANSFRLGNNEDGNATIGGSSVTRGSLTGATLSNGWHYTYNGADEGTTYTAGHGLPAARDGSAVVAYRGYMYAISGNVAGTNSTDVQYAPINANGTIGTWATTASINGARGSTAAVAYNGYLYILGGNYDGTTYANDVQYAPINANGSLGAWHFTYNSTDNGTTQAGGFTTARFGLGVTTYNGYLYLGGGCSSWFINSCNGNQGDVQYAPINANGTIGTWNTTTAFAGSNAGQIAPGFVASNNYLYLVGGVKMNAGSTTPSNAVMYAPINANGTIGTWVTTTSMITARGTLGVAVANGYIYAAGGWDGSNFISAVEYAPIYANGSLGGWGATASIMTGRKDVPTVLYNGYLYIAGGLAQSSGGACTVSTNSGYACSDVQYAKIDSVGPTGLYSTTGTGANSAGAGVYDTSGNARSWPSVAAYGGYMYIVAGLNVTAGTYYSSILYAPINTDGTLGTWKATTKSLNTARAGAGVAITNGNMYVTSGMTTGNSYLGDTEWAPIVASSGDITTAFTDDTTHTVANPRQYPGTVINNGYLYVIGGRNTNNQNSLADIQYAPLASAGGISAAWQTTTQALPTPEALAAVAIDGNRLYVIGGNSGSSTDSTVYYSKFDASGGNISTAFGTTQSISSGRYAPSASISNGYIYVVAGHGSSDFRDTQYAAICTGSNTTTQFTTNCNTSSTPGTTSSWKTGVSVASNGFDQATVTYNGYAYVIGGCASQGVLTFQCSSTTNTYNTVQYAALNNGGGGAAAGWTNTGATNLAAARKDQETVAYNGYLYVLGGQDGSNAWLTSVQYAPITSAGNGSWTATNSYATGNNDQAIAAFAYNGYMYKIGGTPGSSGVDSDVQYAPINSNGSLGTWKYTYNNTSGTSQGGGLATGRYGLGAAAYNGRIYVVGGCTSTSILNPCTSITNTVETAAINPDGTVGAWSTIGTNLPSSRWNLRLVIYNGYLYAISGCDAVSSGACSDYTSRVDYALTTSSGLASDAGCGSMWCSASNTPYALFQFAAYAYNGYLYTVGGQNATGTALNSVSYAPILSNGMLGNWMISPSTFPTARSDFGTGAAYNGKFYIVGGCTGGGNCNATAIADVEIGGPQSIPRLTHFSYLVDLKGTVGTTLGGDPLITRYKLGYSLAGINSTLSACWQGATTALVSGNNVLGSSTCTTNPGNQTFIPWRSYGRFGFVFVTLDDSQTATFPDASQSSLTEIDTYFHAAANRRLRGGKTFTDMGVSGGTQNQLDTEGVQ